MEKVIVIGGGAAGMMAAGVCGERKLDVILFEKNKRLGQKLFITGKGRCNITNECDVETLLDNTPGNPSFLYSAFYTFDSYSTMDFFRRLGLKIKTERGDRVFPLSDKAGDVVRTFEDYLTKNHVEVHLKEGVTKVLVEDKKFKGIVTDTGKTYEADAVIIATGGLSYSYTGSTGDGYKFAEQLGHKIISLNPSLVPLITKEKWVHELQGLTLKNVGLSVKENGKTIHKDFGEMIFTHYGVSGPIILTASRQFANKFDKNLIISIDLKPALTEKELDTRLIRDFSEYINKDFKNALNDLLPQKLIPIMIDLSKIPEDKKVHDITKEERKRLGGLLKNLSMTIIGNVGYEEAVITCGGVCVDEIDPSTMESKIVKGIHFAGEVIDIDSYTGGFNLQLAFSTGYLAGIKVCNEKGW